MEISDAAAEVLERAYEAAARFNPDAKVRIYQLGDRIETGFADAPEEGDEVIEKQDMTIYVERGITGTLDTSEEHDRLIVK